MAGDYTSDDPAERLAAVREVIARVHAAQAHRSGGQGHDLPTLATLYAREDQIVAEIERLGGGSATGSMASLGEMVEPA